MLVNLGGDLSAIFGTPILVRKLFSGSDANAKLETAIRTRTGTEGVRVSNVGGWQSRPDFFDWQEPEVMKLGAEVDRAVEQFVSFGRSPAQGAGGGPKVLKIGKAAWVNVNRAGDYNILHNHPGQDFAAVYYVKADRAAQPGAGGQLELRDPRPAAGFSSHPKLFNAEPLQITPEAGMLVLFPSWIEHMVHPHRGPQDRISVAINIKLIDFDD